MANYSLIYAQYDEHLVTIRKNKPKWQAGKLNLPGGKIEDGEDPSQGAARELYEETGLLAKHLPEVGHICDGDYNIYVFQAVHIDGNLLTEVDEGLIELVHHDIISSKPDWVDQNIVLMHGLISNDIAGWTIYHTEQGYEIKLPYSGRVAR